MKTIQFLTIVVFFSLSFISCKKDFDANEEVTKVVTPTAFNYETTKSRSISLTGGLNQAHATFKLYTANPNNGGKLIGSGKLNENGQFESTYILSTSLRSVFLKSTHIGLPGDIDIPVSNGAGYFDFTVKASAKRGGGNNAPQAFGANSSVYHYMGGYNSIGVPNYLEVPGDVVSQDFLSACNASLPEKATVPAKNPHYLATGNSTDLKVVAPADVWITFMHEGAGYKNTLGYYVYETANPPATKYDIDSIQFIFPNVSFSGSGGGLSTGDKVYLGQFPAGKSIGWVIIQNAWNGSSVDTSKLHFYSNPDFNPESSAVNRQHNVQLYDRDRDVILIGFEDLHREQGSDDDFNDAVFYVSANPITSIETGTLPPLTNGGNDSDGDNVPDDQDDYPNDPNKAFNNYTPFEGAFSSVAFEDLWPIKGDYDFNDLVMKMNYNSVTNGTNELVELKMKMVVDHIGASFTNGFGIELPVTPSAVQNVTGYNITNGIVNLNNKGLETGQSKAVLIAFDNANDNLHDTMNIDVDFSSPTNFSAFNQAGLNPFIFIDQNRGRELHLPGFEPTDKMDHNFFGTGDDASNPSAGVYYKTSTNEPWGINISHDYVVPVEGINISQEYLKFQAWVNSNGTLFTDWYENNSGYRNNTFLQ